MNFILTTLIANLTKTDTDFPILHKHTKQAYRFKLPIRPVGVSHPTFYIDKLNFEYQACNSISVRRLPGTAKLYSFNTKIQSSCTHRKQQKYHFRFRATDFFWAMGHRYCILCIAIWGSGGGSNGFHATAYFSRMLPFCVRGAYDVSHCFGKSCLNRKDFTLTARKAQNDVLVSKISLQELCGQKRK